MNQEGAFREGKLEKTVENNRLSQSVDAIGFAINLLIPRMNDINFKMLLTVFCI